MAAYIGQRQRTLTHLEDHDSSLGLGPIAPDGGRIELVEAGRICEHERRLLKVALEELRVAVAVVEQVGQTLKLLGRRSLILVLITRALRNSGTKRLEGAPSEDAVLVNLVDGTKTCLDGAPVVIREALENSADSILCIANQEAVLEVEQNHGARFVDHELDPRDHALLTTQDRLGRLASFIRPRP